MNLFGLEMNPFFQTFAQRKNAATKFMDHKMTPPPLGVPTSFTSKITIQQIFLEVFS